MTVMPGYVSDEAYDGVDDGLKAYKVRAFWYQGSTTFNCIGNKADGTGSKLFGKDDPDDTEWFDGHYTDGAGFEGDANLWEAPHARLGAADGQELYATTYSGSTSYMSEYGFGSPAVTDRFATLETNYGTRINPLQLTRGAEDTSDRIWFNKPAGDVGYLSGSAVTLSAYPTDSYYVNGLVESSRGLWMIGYTFQPFATEVRLWDRASTLADQVIIIPSSRGGAIGMVAGIPVVIVDEFIDSNKGTATSSQQFLGGASFSVRAVQGASTETLYRFTSPSSDVTASSMVPVSNNFKDSFMFYGKFATDTGATTFRQGMWAVGRKNSNSPLALSLLLDMTDLGDLNGYYGFGNRHFIAHGSDWSVSKLDNYATGTYDVTATYESLMFGSETPNEKVFNGVTVKTCELPSGASVIGYYRTDIDDSWTTLHTSSTAGEKIHNFTRASGNPVGTFEEIQFKFEVVGKVKIKNIKVSIEELNNLPYDS
jgi:hypothetical protein